MNPPKPDEAAVEPRWTRALGHAGLRQALTGLAAAAICLPLLSFEFGFDQGVFATMADAMANGQVLYRDAWEHKPPGVYYMFGLGFVLFGRDYWAARIVELLCVGLSAAGLVRLSEDRFGSRLGGVMSGLSFGILYLLMGGNSAQAEAFQIPFVVWGLVLWPKEGVVARLKTRCFAAGSLLGAALLFKTPSLFIPVAVLVDRLCLDVEKEGWKGRLGLTGITAAGIAAPMAALVGYYAARGAFEPLMDALLVYPSKYAAMGVRPAVWTRVAQGGEWLTRVVPVAGLLLMGLGLVRGLLERRDQTVRWLVVTLAAWAAVAIQGKNFSYYYYVALPFVALGLGLGFPGTPRAGAVSLRPVPLRAAAGFLAIIALSFYASAASPLWRDFRSVARRPEIKGEMPPAGLNAPLDRDLAEGVKALTAPGDLIYVWGNRPLVYFLSDRRPAGGAFHLMQVAPPWGDYERVERLVERLGRENPRLILVCSGPQWWARNKDAKLILEERPVFKEFLELRYSLARKVGECEYWTSTRLLPETDPLSAER